MPYRFRITAIELLVILAIVAMAVAAILSYALSMTDLTPTEASVAYSGQQLEDPHRIIRI